MLFRGLKYDCGIELIGLSNGVACPYLSRITERTLVHTIAGRPDEQ